MQILERVTEDKNGTEINPVKMDMQKWISWPTKVAEIEITYKPLIPPAERTKIKSSEDAYRILLDTWDKGKLELQEQFRMILINSGGGVLGILTLCDGGMDCAFVDRRLVFASALKGAASSIIIAHNHPSGYLRPSEPDKKLTQILKCAGEILGIKLHDHLILGAEGYFSFADSGFL